MDLDVRIRVTLPKGPERERAARAAQRALFAFAVEVIRQSAEWQIDDVRAKVTQRQT